MRHLPFAWPGRFYRGNLHTHSTRSDGKLTPSEVVAAYRGRGYDFIALTDHFIERYGFPITDTRPLRADGFTTILGAELHLPAIENGENWHILAVGLPLDFPRPEDGDTAPELAARARGAGAFVGLAHPAWLGLTLDDAWAAEAAHAVEVHNEGHTQDTDRGNGWYLADLLLNRGRRVLAYAADDAHFGARPDAFGGWVQVRAESLDPDELLAALRAGRYYSSTGPELHDVAVDPGADQLRVACSPARAVYATGRGALGRYLLGEGLTEACFPLAPFRERGGFLRVTTVDAAGKRAWTNPIWLDGDEAK